ncbi:MAG TPA: hypothetical protein VFI23_11485 [Rhizomicrobium sp.]|nr:hypothetical protein [Rhizomicrobium sp.]
MTKESSLADDLLEGAAEIAQFIFGTADERRRVYHLAHIGQIPCFRMGGVLIGRKSTLLAWISQREQDALAGHD